MIVCVKRYHTTLLGIEADGLPTICTPEEVASVIKLLADTVQPYDVITVMPFDGEPK